MATKEEYAQWIVTNAAKKGTPEFETVRKAYESLKEPAVENGGLLTTRAEADMYRARQENPDLARMMDKGNSLPSAESIAGNPVYRALQGVSDPLIGAGQALANITGIGDETVNKFVNEREQLIREGRAENGDRGFDIPRTFGNLAFGVAAGRALPSMQGMGLGAKAGLGAAEGAAFGAATPTEGDSRQDVLTSKLLAAGLGGALGGSIPVAAEGIKYAGGKLAGMLDLSDAGIRKRLGQVLRDVSGEKADDVVAALRKNPSELTPGMAAVEAGSPGFSAFDEIVSRGKGTSLDRQEAINKARLGLLDFAGTSDDLATALKRRDANAGTAFDDAFTQNLGEVAATDKLFGNPTWRPAITQLEPYLNDPMVKRILPSVKEEAARRGVRENSLEFYHLVKKGMDDVIATRAVKDEGLGPTQLASAIGVKDRLVGAMQNLSDKYGLARQQFIKDSSPVNQMQVAQGLRNRLTGPLSQYADDATLNAVGGEMPDVLTQRAAAFEAGLQNEASTIKTASGRAVGTLKEIFSDKPQALDSFAKVSDSLNREVRLKRLVSAGASMADHEIHDLGSMRLVNALQKEITIANAVLKRMGNKQVQSVADLMYELQKKGDMSAIAQVMEDASKQSPAVANTMKMLEYVGANRQMIPQISGILANELTE